ncbi:MAG: DUF1640 domain-containing protein [Chromatiales bacterium]
MSTITFDTHEYIKRLRAAGFSEDQAEALSSAQKESLAQALLITLATKEDIMRLERRMDGVDAQLMLIKWMMGIILGGIIALILKAFFPV